MAAKLLKLAATWNHKRDSGYYVYPDGSTQRLWDSGCHRQCERCQLEAFVVREMGGKDGE